MNVYYYVYTVDFYTTSSKIFYIELAIEEIHSYSWIGTLRRI